MMLAVTSCQSVKNALSGVKKENSDEFLVQKKNPLVLPPDFTDLPQPFEESSQVTEVQIEEDIAEVRDLISSHVSFTNSELGKNILNKWEAFESSFVKVMPRDYRKVLDALKRVEEKGLTGDEAALAAFHEAVA